jgi:hypothetical protein
MIPVYTGIIRRMAKEAWLLGVEQQANLKTSKKATSLITKPLSL